MRNGGPRTSALKGGAHQLSLYHYYLVHMGEAPRALPPGTRAPTPLRGSVRRRRSTSASAFRHELSTHHLDLDPQCARVRRYR
eukprot:scaffold229065_cov33-Tisochrysis_lutea.AAC.1